MKHIYIITVLQLCAQFLIGGPAMEHPRSRIEFMAWNPLTIIRNSDEIVVALGQSVKGTIADNKKSGENVNSGDNKVGIILEFTVLDSLKGELKKGDVLYVFIKKTSADFSPVLSHLESGVMFLMKMDKEEIEGLYYKNKVFSGAPVPEHLYKFAIDRREQWKAWIQVPSFRPDDRELNNRLNKLLNRDAGLSFDHDILVEYIRYLIELSSLSAQTLADINLDELDTYARKMVQDILAEAKKAESKQAKKRPPVIAE